MAMAVIDGESFYPAKPGYWDAVEETMIKVFDAQPDEARALTSAHLRALADVPPTERLLEFNAEPLYVAADLLGRNDADQQISRYTSRVRRPGHGEPAAGSVAAFDGTIV